jgi:hypothetical protein
MYNTKECVVHDQCNITQEAWKQFMEHQITRPNKIKCLPAQLLSTIIHIVISYVIFKKNIVM